VGERQLVAGLGLRPTPYLLALVTASNIGSAATLTGNPQNMLIGVASHLPYAAFFRSLLPVALVGLGLDFLVIAAAASVTMLAFFFAGANLSIVALTAGAALLLTRRVKPEKRCFTHARPIPSGPSRSFRPSSPTWSPTSPRSCSSFR
jgi:Na+/H+ antiporter NhaD/arsenite permease-like protein